MLMTRIDPVASSVRYTCWPSTKALWTPPVTDSVYSARTLGWAGSAGIENDDAVLPVRGAFAREHADLAVGRRADVVHDAGVEASESTLSGAAGLEMSYTHSRPATADVTYM